MSPTTRPSRRKPVPPGMLAEEIERIRALLHRLDTILSEKEDLPLKDLAQAIAIASSGGKSIAWLRKYEQSLAETVQEGDMQQMRSQLFEMLAALEKDFIGKTGA
jgi:hypothetical protein